MEKVAIEAEIMAGRGVRRFIRRTDFEKSSFDCGLSHRNKIKQNELNTNFPQWFCIFGADDLYPYNKFT